MKNRSAIGPGRMRQADSHQQMPKEPGVYRHVDRATGRVDYVGQTGNLQQRAYQHTHAGKLDPATQRVEYQVARPDASRDALCRDEARHIAKHQPPGNTTRGGNGRR